MPSFMSLCYTDVVTEQLDCRYAVMTPGVLLHSKAHSWTPPTFWAAGATLPSPNAKVTNANRNRTTEPQSHEQMNFQPTERID